MKLFVTLCLVVALAASASAHTYISHILVNGNTDVNTASQKYTLDSGWACRFDGPDQTFGPGGMTCTGPCDDVDYPWPIPNPPAKTTVARGAQLEVRWPRNNHPGGFIRLAWARTADRYSHEAFDNGVMSVSCHETGNGCFSRGGPGLLDGDDNGSDGLVNPCIYSTTVPTWLPDGEFTLQWSWFGGGFTLGDYYSCSDFVIAGGPVAGNYPPGQGDINVNMDDINVGDGSGCRYFNTDELHVCVEEPCSRGQSKFQYADLRVGTPELSNYNNLAPGTPPATPAPPPVTTVELTSGVSQTNTLSKDDFQPYYIVVPGGSSRLVINVAPQGASDPDLFCSRNDANVGTTAGAATWAREEGGGTTEVLDLTNPSPGTYYCNVLGWTDTTYDITAVVTGPTTVPCANDCSGHGTCNTNNGQCSCQTDWGPAGDGDCNTYTDPNGGNNGVTVLSSGQSVSGDVGLKAYDQYSYDVQTAGSTVTFTLEPGSADVDIYVSRVPEPSSKQSEWSSTRGGTQVDEIERTGNVVVAATYYIAVHGWEASDYELTVTEEGAKVTENAYPTLSDGIGLDANVGLRDYNFYNIDLGADQAATLTLVSTTGDADVYCKREGEGVPSTFDSTFKSEDYRRVESMEISGSSNFVCGIYGYAASSDYTVKYETNNIRQACAGVGGCMGGDCTPGSGMSDGECDCWDEWSTASCAFMSSEIDVEQYACPSSKSGDGVTHSTAVPAGETLTHVITVEEDERITFSGVSDLPLTLYAKKDACPTATDYDFTVTTFGSDNDYSIETGCDNEAHMTAGNWYVMAEQAQGGESKMQGKGSVSSCKSTLSFILIGAGAIVAIAIIGIIIAAVFIIRKKKNGTRY